MNTTAIRINQPRSRAQMRKHTKPSLRRVEMLLGLLFLVAVTSLFLGYVTQSSAFRVKRVLFEGTHILPEEDILLAAGITTDDNIIFLDTESVAKRVQDLPYVKRCEVKRMYPDEVLLRIMERKAIATIMVNNNLYEIDRENVVLRQLSPQALQTGPLITNLPGVTVMDPGTAIESEALAAALQLWEDFRELSFSRDITLSEISATHPSDLRMYFNELPYEIRWGRSDFATQAKRFEVLWNQMEGAIPCEYYLDLRFDADLVCK
jgi:cell division protein FtsQ